MGDFNDIERAIRRALNNRGFKQRLANKTRDIIYRRTKQGIGLKGSKNNFQPSRLRSLSALYIKRRSRGTRLGEFGSPGKSNLTLSGQMLNSMVGRVTDFGVRVEIPDSKRGAVSIGGRAVPQKKTNRQIAVFVQKSRRFFGLTNDEKEILFRQIDTFLQKIIKSLK